MNITKKIILMATIFSIQIGRSYGYQEYIKTTIAGKGVQLIRVILDDQHHIVVGAVPSGQTPKSIETFMTENKGAVSAINGGFFCPAEKAYSRCDENTTQLLRISNSVLMSKRGEDISANSAVFGFDNANSAMLVDNTTRIRESTRTNKLLDNMTNGISMPALLKDGINIAKNNSEMNSDAKQSKVGNKSFICSTSSKEIYMGYIDGQTFSSIADFIKDNLGCRNAIFLDNGGSKAMVYDNQVITAGRNIMDSFLIIEDSIQTQAIQQKNDQIVKRMFNNGLTKYSTIDSFMPTNNVTREQAAKFFVQFVNSFSGTNKFILETSNTTCNFKDIQQADPTLKDYIIQSCKLGFFKGTPDSNFMPTSNLTKAQAITVLVRIIQGKQDETTTPWYKNNIQKAQDLALLEGLNTAPGSITLEFNANRLFVGNLIYNSIK